MVYDSRYLEKYQEYVAPVLGNGEMAFQMDYEGGMSPERRSEKIFHNPGIKIWWAGRRGTDPTQLLPFGYFRQKLMVENEQAELVQYTQELDTQRAVVTSKCVYSDGISMDSAVAIHHDHNLIMVNRSHTCEKDTRYIFEYILDSQDGYFQQQAYVCPDGSIAIVYTAARNQQGIIRLFSDTSMKVEIKDHVFSMICAMAKGKSELTCYLLFCDNIDTNDYVDVSESIKNNALKKGFRQLLAGHTAGWENYYAEGFAETEDAHINEVYRTAQYHLKCYTTPWSIPVGLCDALWQGRYFAFDEFYMLMALLSSNHMNAACRIPSFRAAGLEKAIKRGSSARSLQEARYPWETLETGDEGCSLGYWCDHVFHMACIACGEYYYYQFTGDEQFLREKGYPVIKACASFYTNHMLYEVSDRRLIVGKCTDLERLGSSVANAYMTTCGVVKTLKIFSEMAELLGTDLDMAAEYAEKAERLLEALPNNGEQYIPYEGCTETSVGLMSGLYPFDVIDKGSSLQRKGIQSYLLSEQEKGNMYAVGGGVCPWYMAWKAIVHERLEEEDNAYSAIKSAAENAGNFAEMYEINDISGSTVYRPWFATAAGMFLQAVNEMMLSYREGILYIAPTVPKSMKNFSFQLAAAGGMTARVAVCKGEVEQLMLMQNTNFRRNDVTVAVPSHLGIKKIIGNHIYHQKSDATYHILRVEMKREIT